MTWRNQYWNMISNVYWNPMYMGLKSIAWNKLEKDGETVRVPCRC